jgi:hypothetical protein
VLLLHGNGSMIADFVASGIMDDADTGHRFARALGASPNTVETHLAHCYDKERVKAQATCALPGNFRSARICQRAHANATRS